MALCVARSSAAMICRIGSSLSYLRKDFKYPCHINVCSNEIKCKYMFMFHLKNVAHKGVMSYISYYRDMIYTQQKYVCYISHQCMNHMNTNAPVTDDMQRGKSMDMIKFILPCVMMIIKYRCSKIMINILQTLHLKKETDLMCNSIEYDHIQHTLLMAYVIAAFMQIDDSCDIRHIVSCYAGSMFRQLHIDNNAYFCATEYLVYIMLYRLTWLSR